MVVALFRPAVLRYQWEFSQLIRRGGCWVSLVVQVNQSVWEGRETEAVFSLVTHKPVVLVSLFFWLKPLSTLCYFLSYCPFFVYCFAVQIPELLQLAYKEIAFTSGHVQFTLQELEWKFACFWSFFFFLFFCKATVLFVAYCITPSSFASILGVHKCARGVSWCFCGVFCGACMHLLPQCNRLNGQGLLFVRLYVPTLELEHSERTTVSLWFQKRWYSANMRVQFLRLYSMKTRFEIFVTLYVTLSGILKPTLIFLHISYCKNKKNAFNRIALHIMQHFWRKSISYTWMTHK